MADDADETKTDGKRPRPVKPTRDLPIRGERKAAAKTCPLCKDGLDDDPALVRRCTGCRARYHLGCLGESQTGGAIGCVLCGGTVFKEKVDVERRFAAQDRERSVQRVASMAAGVVGCLAFVPYLAMVGMGAIALGLGGPSGGLKGFSAVAAIFVALALAWTTGAGASRLIRFVAARRTAARW